MQIECDAVIFDLDGILVDSNAISERHWAQWAEGHDIPVERVLASHHGRPTVQIISSVAPHLDAPAEARAKETREADDTEGLLIFEGAASLISNLPETRWAIVTSGTRRTATIRLSHVGLPIPQIFVTADDILHGKPDPEPYQKAIERLGFTPDRCVVVEDAPAGIASGKAAGACVIGVASTNLPAALSAADFVVPRLADLHVSRTEHGLLLTSVDKSF